MPHSTTDALTPKQRRQTIAAILGRGLLRLNGARGKQPATQVRQETRKQRSLARSRIERRSARRRAVEMVLSRHGLLIETGDVSHDFRSDPRTE